MKMSEENKQAQMPENQLFIDGVATVGLRQGVVRIDCYDAVSPAVDGGEVRKLSHRLHMPVAAMVELQGMLANAIQQMQEANSNKADDVH